MSTNIMLFVYEFFQNLVRQHMLSLYLYMLYSVNVSVLLAVSLVAVHENRNVDVSLKL